MIGRKEAIHSLEWDLEKEEPQFVAVYGRRRVGKTYLIRTFITAHGLAHNQYWGTVQSEVALDDLFEN